VTLHDDIAALRRIADDLDETLAANRVDIETGIRAQWPDWDDAAVAHGVLRHMDRYGRSVLLDAMSALGQARAAIVQGEIAMADLALADTLSPIPTLPPEPPA
jgi:hypothetical protein